ncbi:MAG: NeuD/PglB/VioB family sugar acetyltransferase [Agriterribacter sp.]
MNKVKLFIIGSGNVGGFVAYNFDDFQLGGFEIQGFLDEDEKKWGKSFAGYPVLGGIDLLTGLQEKIAVVITIANPSSKRKIIDKISRSNITFPSLISKAAWVSKQVSVGEGVIIYPGVSINYHTRVEDFVTINMNAAIGHDCVLQKYTTLAPGVSLAGFTFIEEEVDMGINSATKQSLRIGKGAIIGGMAMVTHNIPEGVTAVGVPAKIIKSL